MRSFTTPAAGGDPSPASPAPPLSPQAVVQEYLAAVNQHDWARAWQLGGKNLGTSYQQMVVGYRHTAKVTISSLTARGDAVSVRVLAYETTGAVQAYLLRYLVSDGVIIAGQSTLLSTTG